MIKQKTWDEENSLTHKKIKNDNVLISMLLAISISLMFANFWYVNTQDENDKRYIALSGELRILSQSIATYADNAADGTQDAFELLRNRRDEFENDVDKLANGDPKTHLPPSASTIQQNELLRLQNAWGPLREKIDDILNRQTSLLELYQIFMQVSKAIPAIQSQYDKVITIMLNNHVSAEQISIVGRQKWTAEKILRHLDKVLEGGHDAEKEALAFSEEVRLFESSLKNNKDASPEVNKILANIAVQMAPITDNVDKIMTISKQLMIVRSAAKGIFVGSQSLLDHTTELLQAYVRGSQTRWIGPLSGYLLGGMGILLLLLLSYKLYADTKLSLETTAAQHRANRAAVLRLLDELADLAEGDLTVHATVETDITGAIAESVNYAIDALRKLVVAINDMVVQVSSLAQDVQTNARELAGASEHQVREIVGTSGAINAMAGSIEQVSHNATESRTVSERSVNIAKHGVEIVQQTISGMDRIKVQIQETTKQVKRLGESSQEIGNIVSLIDDITDQTNILALNAAIQAAMAGEEGRGFAVVAEEVQRLAERSSQATKQIESLVHAIQEDTNQTIRSMEQTTIDVVQGAQLAQNAGVALENIEKVSSSLATLIQNISNEAYQQSITAGKVSKTMEIIKEITIKNSSRTHVTALSLGDLAALAVELRDSVAGFTLPTQDEKGSGFPSENACAS